MEDFIAKLSTIDAGYVYLAIFVISYIENLFPPFPSDVLVVFGGSLIAIGKGHAVFTLLFATAGSTLGFVSMYAIGKRVGDRWLESGRIRFISVDLVRKVEQWFQRYGYWIIVANRFLAGTRAAVAFCAGASEMNLRRTTILSAISALAWNTLLVYFGFTLGENWRSIGDYLSTYSLVVSIVIAALVSAWIIIAWLRNRRARARNGGGGGKP
jgi:membrane protein DedA with SNARE-associated domain